MAKPFDPRAKAKRQKIIAGVLGLVLVGVLIFQAPTILGMFGGGSSSTASESAATTTPPAAPATPAPGTAAPATPGAPAAPAAAGSASLVDSDPLPTPTDGQLVSFDRFESKDPFVQQVGGRPAAGQAPAESAPVDPGAKSKNPEGATESKAQPAPPAQPAAPKTARISVNGNAETVALGASFPEGDPIFKLVSLKNGVAKVGIVGGGYANGTPTISLSKGGKPVTLMNTADGTTYVLRYLA